MQPLLTGLFTISLRVHSELWLGKQVPWFSGNLFTQHWVRFVYKCLLTSAFSIPPCFCAPGLRCGFSFQFLSLNSCLAIQIPSSQSSSMPLLFLPGFKISTSEVQVQSCLLTLPHSAESRMLSSVEHFSQHNLWSQIYIQVPFLQSGAMHTQIVYSLVLFSSIK